MPLLLTIQCWIKDNANFQATQSIENNEIIQESLVSEISQNRYSQHFKILPST